MDFGTKLKNLRTRLGKSQVEVAGEIISMFPEARMSQTALSVLEQRATIPRGEVLTILASYYCVPLTYFLGNEDDQVKRTELVKQYLEKLRTNDSHQPIEVTKSVSRSDLLEGLGYIEEDEHLDT